MADFETVLLLLFGGIGLALFAPKIGVPWPALLALSGALLALVPGVPDVSLDPDLALALFVAPVLLDSAYDTSLRDLRRNWIPIGGLVIGAVGVSVVGVAVAARAVDPALPWAAAIALGAIVAPPDAAAAAAVLRQIRLPRRIVIILEGESLLNDATSLLIYRFAVAAAATSFGAWEAPLLVFGAIAGIGLGLLLARLYLAVMARIRDEAAGTVLSFLATFGVWLLADALGVSAVLTMVAFAIALARSAPERLDARTRRASYAVWDVATFVLNVLSFILVGLQLRGILARLGGHSGYALLFAAAVLGAAVTARVVWVLAFYSVWGRRQPDSSLRGGTIIAWCGMRGIVTLAAALALPPGFPARDELVLAAFGVVLGTLVVQGLTLRPLLGLLALPPDGSLEAELDLGRRETAQAAIAALAADLDGDGVRADTARMMQDSYRARLEHSNGPLRDPVGLGAMRQKALAAERACLAGLLRLERIGDDAFHRLEEDLDWAEAEGR